MLKSYGVGGPQDFSVPFVLIWVLNWVGLGWDWVCGDLGLGSKNPRKGVVYWLNPKLSLSIYLHP